MGLLDAVLGSVLGGGQQPTQTQGSGGGNELLMQIVAAMLANRGNGAAGQGGGRGVQEHARRVEPRARAAGAVHAPAEAERRRQPAGGAAPGAVAGEGRQVGDPGRSAEREAR